MLIKHGAVLLAAVAMTGCMALQEAGEIQEKNEELGGTIKETRFIEDEPAAIFVDRPTYKTISVPIERHPDWMKAQIQEINIVALPLHFVVSTVMENTGVNTRFGNSVDPNKLINLRAGGTAKQTLDAVAAVAGYSYRYAEKGNVVIWDKHETETFDVSYLPGKYSYAIGKGKEGQKDSQSGDSEVYKFGGSDSETSQQKADNLDAYEDIKQALTVIINGEGAVSASESSTSIAVSTTSAKMESVREYMDRLEYKLGRQVAFEFKVLKFESERLGHVGVDWNYIKTQTEGILNFTGVSPAPSSNFSTAPISFSVLDAEGTASGTEVFIDALEEQGSVTVATEPRIVSQVNRMVEMDMTKIIGFLAKTEVTTDAEGNTSVELEQGVLETGFTIRAMATLGKGDKINLHWSSSFSDADLIRKEVGGSAVESPNMDLNRQVSSNILKNGETMVLGGMLFEQNEEGGTSPISARSLPTSRNSSNRVIEVVTFVTPVIVN